MSKLNVDNNNNNNDNDDIDNVDDSLMTNQSTIFLFINRMMMI